ncbi:hypothetical protein ColLi_09462 [Colletotrichum liriopes]|uniref:Uncharacterized protein n=1 Tax=Colletotrichum liriopes TaxID=708192 RepID=A0AA37GSV3_9PEZI|nr:hypothetical protein ColLi_09462 [Colletotrichum liriopes]
MAKAIAMHQEREGSERPAGAGAAMKPVMDSCMSDMRERLGCSRPGYESAPGETPNRPTAATIARKLELAPKEHERLEERRRKLLAAPAGPFVLLQVHARQAQAAQVDNTTMQTRVQEAKATMEEPVRLSVKKRDAELHPGFFCGSGPVPRSQMLFEHATGYVSTPPLGRPESRKRGHRGTVDGEYTLESPPRANAARPGMTLNVAIGFPATDGPTGEVQRKFRMPGVQNRTSNGKR